MTTTTSMPSTPRRSFGERLRRNPITLKEMRGRMRGRRAFVVLTLNALLLGGFVALLYLSYATSSSVSTSPRNLQSLGKAIFAVTVGLQLLVTCFTSSSAAVGAISSERERQTFELLRTTLLPARSLVLGKLWAALLFNLLLILSAIPIASLSFLFGGVTFEEIFIASVVLIVTAIAFSSIGLFFSSLMRRTSQATAVSTVVTLALVIGIPILMFILQGLLSTMVYMNSQNGVTDLDAEIARTIILWLMISISPLSSGIATFTVLLDNKSALTMTMPLSSGPPLVLPSPWIVYSVFCVLLSGILIMLSIRAVKRVEK
jgi:ABC-type transport system involved in multi-copper enzyme maturation permease subunit